MHVQTLEQSPQNHRGGQVSHLLLAPGQFGTENLAVTWVEGEPGSEQPLHSHPGQRAGLRDRTRPGRDDGGRGDPGGRTGHVHPRTAGYPAFDPLRRR